uniref:Guanylate cyclase n=1 Tax=Panagrolaimus sp. PS1159 TaxID=55785 RepID=A0AC35FRL0_9BILA
MRHEGCFGWIHESFRQLVTRKYGRDTWIKIVTLAKFEEGLEPDIGHYYKDEDTLRMVHAMGNVIGIPIEEVWEAYGGFLIQFTMETGWDELLRAMSSDLEGFLDSLDSLHYFIDHVVYRTKLKGPSFRCDPQPDGSLLLHYYSRRSGLYPIVKGVVREVARRIYDTEILMRVLERKQEHLETFVMEHVVFVINQVETSGTQGRSITSKSVSSASIDVSLPNEFNVNLRDFCTAFPHHVCFNKFLVIEHVGIVIKNTYPNIIRGETKLSDILELVHPEIPLSYDSIRAYRNSLFIFKLKKSIEDSIDDVESTPVTIKGAMIYVNSGEHVVYLCSLNVTTVRELLERNLYISDMQRHDSTRDLIMLNQSRMSQVELNRKLEETTRNLKKMALELENEKQKTEDLLKELMPSSVAQSLRNGHAVEASEFSEATVLFTDIVTFTNICALCTPYDVVNLLNDLYLRFDRMIGLNDVYKVETIGDAYVIVGGVPQQCNNHAERVLNVAIGMLMESKCVLSPINGSPIKIRVGVHSGAVVAGVVGMKMPRYCLFGDTVNVANKLESAGIAGRIHVSESAKVQGLRTNPAFVFSPRGNVDIKGKGNMYTYFLEKNDRKSVWEITGKKREGDETIDGYAELYADGESGEVSPERIEEMKKKKHQATNGNNHEPNGVQDMQNSGYKVHRNESQFCNIL